MDRQELRAVAARQGTERPVHVSVGVGRGAVVLGALVHARHLDERDPRAVERVVPLRERRPDRVDGGGLRGGGGVRDGFVHGLSRADGHDTRLRTDVGKEELRVVDPHFGGAVGPKSVMFRIYWYAIFLKALCSN